MKDTDIIHLDLDITLYQARYLRRKMHKLAREKFSQHKRTRDPIHEDTAMMTEGLAVYIEEKIKEFDHE